jgi:hypothetical protein
MKESRLFNIRKDIIGQTKKGYNCSTNERIALVNKKKERIPLVNRIKDTIGQQKKGYI